MWRVYTVESPHTLWTLSLSAAAATACLMLVLQTLYLFKRLCVRLQEQQQQNAQSKKAALNHTAASIDSH